MLLLFVAAALYGSITLAHQLPELTGAIQSNHAGRSGRSHVQPPFLDVTPKASLFASFEQAAKVAQPLGQVFAAAACDPGSLELAAGRTLLCVSPATGNVTGVYDVPTSQPFHYPGAQTSVFQLVLAAALTSPQRNDPLVPLPSSACASVIVSGGGAEPISWSFTGCSAVCGGAPVAASVTLRAAVLSLPTTERVPDLIAFTMNVTGIPASCAVSTATYPLFISPPTLVDAPGSDDAFLSPTGDGTLIPSIGLQNIAQQDTYPGQACVQLMARVHQSAATNASVGLLFATLDDAAYTKAFAVYSSPSAGFSLMQVDALFSEVPGADIEVSYPVVLASFAGDWHAAALLYKAWSDEQWWTARLITDRTDLPPWLLDGSIGMVVGIQNGSGFLPEVFGPHLEQLPAWAAQIADAVSAPRVVVVPYGYEHFGMWAGIFYDPPQPNAASWTSVIQNMTQNGNAIAFLVSGYWWVVRRQETTCGPAFDNTALLEPLSGMLIKLRNGSNFNVDAYNDPTGPLPWVGYSVHMCHGAANASATMQDIFAADIDLGVQLVSFDQEIGGGQSPCYDESHGHPLGYGPWMFEALNATMAAIHAFAAERNTTVALCTEQTGELLIPAVATFYGRQYAATNWPWGSNIGGTAVGLFSFLYHEYVPVTGAEFGVGITSPAFDTAFLLRYVVAASLVEGTMPIYSSWMIANNISLAAEAYGPAYTTWKRHLFTGRTIVPPAVQASVTYGTEANVTVTLRNVLSGALIGYDASVVVVLAQATNTPQPYTVDFTSWASAPQLVACSGGVQLLTANATVLATWPVLPPTASATLQPLDVHVYTSTGCTAVTDLI